MTSNKDLEKLEQRMIKRLNNRCPPDWWHIISMTGAILGIVALLFVLFGQLQYTPASPCELCELLPDEMHPNGCGWVENMDSEYCEGLIECIAYREGYYSKVCFWEMMESNCDEKSCLYSGPGIMVVKE